jgi:hypothetical protein
MKCWLHLMDLLGDGVKWKLILVHSEIVLINTQDRCMVCTERAIGSKILLGRIEGLLGDVGQMEAHFGFFGDLSRTCNKLKNCFGRTHWNYKMTWVKWKFALVHLEMVLILVKIWALFAPNVPQAWKFFWAHPMDLLSDVGQLEAHFAQFALNMK